MPITSAVDLVRQPSLDSFPDCDFEALGHGFVYDYDRLSFYFTEVAAGYDRCAHRV